MDKLMWPLAIILKISMAKRNAFLGIPSIEFLHEFLSSSSSPSLSPSPFPSPSPSSSLQRRKKNDLNRSVVLCAHASDMRTLSASYLSWIFTWPREAIRNPTFDIRVKNNRQTIQNVCGGKLCTSPDNVVRWTYRVPHTNFDKDREIKRTSNV